MGGVAINSDPDGNVITDGTDTYTYDADNRLSSVNSLQSSVYTYDPFDRRVGKVVDGAETYFIYDGDMVVAEVDATGALLSEYVNTNNIDEVLTMDRGGVTYYYHYDGLGSVTEVTDSAGTIVENYTYDPYGNPSVTNSLIENPYMFTGRRWDEESTLYHYRARVYDPSFGRFLQRDPIGYYDHMNLYAYVRNNPLNYIDPEGELPLFSSLMETPEEIEEGQRRRAEHERGLQELIDRINRGDSGFSTICPKEPSTFDQMSWALSSVSFARVFGPFSPKGLPKWAQRLRKYFRFDPPHHAKGWHFDGDMINGLKNLFK